MLHNNTSMSAKPIVIIEDDVDDRDFICKIMSSLPVSHPLLTFANGREALTYFATTTDEPLLVICDINMPMINGLELRLAMIKDDEIRKKVKAFVFLTTGVSPHSLLLSSQLQVQGLFEKPTDYDGLSKLLTTITCYWENSL
jgi:CheY-like chemotaxis protein